MEIELHCARCLCRFSAPPLATLEAVHDRMFEEGSWFGLADADTFEDMIFATVVERGAILCVECGGPVSINEKSLGQLVHSSAKQ